MKFNKGIRSVVLALVSLLLSIIVVPTSAIALPATVACGGGGTFTITGTEVTGATGCSGAVVVPEGITALSGQGFYTQAITSISLPNSLVTIGDSTLRSTSLTSLNIPANVTSIGFLSIASYGITSLTFSPGSQLTTIGQYAFQGVNISSITVPASVATVDATSFQSFGTLTTIRFQGNAPTINSGNWVVNASNTPATSILINANATGFTTPNWYGLPVYSPPAFTLSSNTESATAGTPITGYSVSSTGGTITSYVITPAITNGLAFSTSTGLITGTPTGGARAVTYTVTARNPTAVDATNTFTLSVGAAPVSCGGGGALTIVDNVVTSNNGCIGAVVVSQGVTAIASGALNSAAITSINLPNTVTSVGSGVFNAATAVTMNCGDAGSFTLTQYAGGLMVTRPGICKGALVIPEGVTVIGRQAFWRGGMLTSISLPSTLTTISVGAFAYQLVPSIVIPAAVTFIGDLAFSSPGGIKTLKFLGTAANAPLTINSTAFQYAAMSGVTFPANLQTLGPSVFDASEKVKCMNFLGNAPAVSGNISLYVGPAPTVYITPGATGFTSATPSMWKGLSVVTGLTGCIGYSAGLSGNGSAPTSPVRVRFGDTFTTPSNTFTPFANYTFAGWSDGVNTYNENTTYPLTGSVTGSVDFTALWNRAIYTVTFHSNGGVGNMVPQSSSVVANLDMNRYTRANYDFLGWSTNADGSGTQVSNSFVNYPFAANVDLYAKWGAVITYASTGAVSGKPSRAQDNWTSGTINLPLVGTMLRAGYTFESWTATSGSSTAVADPYTPTGTITLHPIWRANSYAISFSANGATGGTVPANQAWVTGNGATTLSGNTGTLVKPGFTFGGWATSASSTVPVTTYGAMLDKTFWAIWTPITYTFSYALNGGSLTPAPTQPSRTIYQTFTTPALTPTKTLSVFGGWNTAADGSGASYGAGKLFTVDSTTASVTTLTAQWIPRYTVHFVGNGSTTTLPGDQLYTSGQSLTLPGEPVLTGYTFDGWLDSSNVLHGHSTPFTVLENSVITAEWSPIPITITYAINGGTSTTPIQPNLYYQNTFRVAATPIRAGYKFNSWSDGAKTYDPDQLYIVGRSNITLTAQWTAISYSIVYDLNGSQGTVPAPRSGTIGTSFAVSNSTPTWVGYTFVGWSDGRNRYIGNETYTVAAANVILTASFTQNGYTTITYLSNGGDGDLPMQDGQLEGTRFNLADGTVLTKPGFVFDGWSDGTSTQQAGFSYYVGSVSNPINLTAQWTPFYTVTYLSGSGAGTPPIDSTQYFSGDIFQVSPATDISQSGGAFSGWSDGSLVLQADDTYTVGSANITLTAQWIQSASASAQTPAPIQQSLITGITPENATAGKLTPIFISGTFVEKILNIQINGNPLPSGSWSQTSTSISFLMPAAPAGSYLIQIYNGSAPVLKVLNVTISMSSPVPTTKPTTKPTPEPTPTISAETTKPLKSTLVLKVYFDMGSAVVSKSNILALKKLAAEIAGLGKKITITATGYAQPTPKGASLDAALSKRRAAAVAKLLIESGVNSKVEYLGAGRALKNVASSRYVEIVAANR